MAYRHKAAQVRKSRSADVLAAQAKPIMRLQLCQRYFRGSGECRKLNVYNYLQYVSWRLEARAAG